MGEVVKLPRKRNETIKGAVRSMASDATGSVSNPCAAILVVLNKDGDYAVRSVSDGQIADCDKYGRSILLLQHEQLGLLEDR